MKIVNDTHYHDDTPDELIEELENARLNNLRVKFVYGKDGKRWWETYDVSGFIGRSIEKIPIILPTKRSIGGGTILTDCIIQLFVGHSQRYIDESMKDILNNYGYEIGYNKELKKFELDINNGEWISRHTTLLSAQRLKDFLIGERLAP
jgi:hypothetical protein